MVWEGDKLGKLNAQREYQIFLNLLLLMPRKITAPDGKSGEISSPCSFTYSVWFRNIGRVYFFGVTQEPHRDSNIFCM